MPSLPIHAWLASLAASSSPDAAVASLALAELERLWRAEEAVLLAVAQASEPAWIPGEYLRRAFSDEQRTSSASDAEGVGGGERSNHEHGDSVF
jgi:hypothetical protein